MSAPEVSSNLRSAPARKGYDVRYFARKHGITPEEARKIIVLGGDRKTLNAAADKLKRQGSGAD